MNNKDFLPIFLRDYHDKMLQPAGVNPVRDRASSFNKIFAHLDSIYESGYYPTIVETGCMRADHGQLAFGDDGCSTYLFDQAIRFYGAGLFISVDISQQNINHARKSCPSTNFYCKDSVSFLLHTDEINTGGVDLLYLDSFDVEEANPHPSALHHLMEMGAAMLFVRRSTSKCPGTMVVIDDADAFFKGDGKGKAMYVRDFLERAGAMKIHDGYQLVYMF